MTKLTLFLYISPGVFSFLLGALPLFLKKKEVFHKYFSLYNFSIFAWVCSLHISTFLFQNGHFNLYLYTTRLTQAFVEIGIVFVLLFFNRFPTPLTWINKYKKYILIYTFSLFFIILFSNLIYIGPILKNGVFTGENFGFLYPLYVLHIITIMITLLYTGYLQLKRLKGIHLRKFKISFFSSCTFFITIILLNVLLPLWNIHLIYGNTGFLALVFSIPTTYSMMRYRFFNIPLLFNMIIRHIVLFLIFTTPVLIFIYTNNILVTSISIILCYILLNTVLRFSKILFKDTLKPLKKLTLKIHNDIYKYDSYDKLVFFLEKTFTTYTNIRTVSFFLNEKHNTFNDMKSIPLNIRNWLSSKDKILLNSEIPFLNIISDKKIKLKDELKEINQDIMIPLMFEKYLIGAFGLRLNNPSSFISYNDVKLLEKLKKPLTNALTNTLLLQNINKDHDLLKNVVDNSVVLATEELKKVQDLFNKQSEFLSIASHDIKTPLTIALFQLEETKKACKNDGVLSKQLNDSFETLVTLKDLTNRLFKVQKYDNADIKQNKQRINLYQEFNVFYKQYKLITDKNQIEFFSEFKINKYKTTKLDKSMLFEAIKNILDNAVKFAPKIILRIKTKKKMLIIQIIDYGVNIPNEKKKLIFDKFKTYSRKLDGIGLGLYISKKIINIFNGEILINDSCEIDKNIITGTTFTIKIPLSN